jgi:mRNA interferase RelE/StbE
MVRVTITPEAAADFDRLPRTIRNRVTQVFERLAGWPNVSGARPLRGTLAGTYRIRTGDYRVLFRVESDEVLVETIGHRSGLYER